MSAAQKDAISFLANTFVKVILAVCGALLTFSYIELKSDVKTQGASINLIQIDMATMKGDIKNLTLNK